MKKISVNKNDCSFENKYKFEDILTRIKALGGSIVKNSKQTFIMGVMVGCLVFSASSIYNLGTDLVKAVEYYSTSSENDRNLITNNDAILEELNKKAIVVANVKSTVESKHHFKDNYLFDNEGNIVFLNCLDKPIYFVNCNINQKTFQNIQLLSSKTKIISFESVSIDNNFIKYLPNTIEQISLNNCHYITNLNELPKRCPNITCITLRANSSLNDLSFIYELPNLKEIYLYDSAYVTKELLDYLISHNIKTNISEQDIINSETTDNIINSIITPDMSDKKKIQAICLYVLNTVEYDIELSRKSNEQPLTCVLEKGKGVCASYAYLTNILLNKAGIKSFEITNDRHGWNIIKLDDKYYYIDTTNMDDSDFYNFLLKVLNISKYYIIDTEATLTTPMSSPSDETTIIPLSLIEDIQVGRNDKDLIEKYGGYIGNISVIIGAVLSWLSIRYAPFLLRKTISDTSDLYSSIKYDYKSELKRIKALK